MARRNQKQSANDGVQKPPKDWWAVVNTGLNTLFTGLLVYLMFHQWRVMRTALKEANRSADAAILSAKTAEQALHLSETADVLIHEARGSDGPLITMGTRVTITLKNCGRTKATDTSIRAYMMAIEHYRSSPATADPIPGEGNGTPTIIGPSGEWSFTLSPVGHTLEPREILEINEGTKRLWINVNVTYQDVFKAPHLVVGYGLFYRNNDGLITMSVSESG